MIWVAFALLTAAAVVSLLWPLTGPAPASSGEDAADIAFYRGQIAEIDAEACRGAIDSEQAVAAKALAARRLLAVAPDEVARGVSPVSRKIAIVLTVLAAPAIALGLYAKIGHPNLPDLPLQARLSTPPAQPGASVAAARMEAYIATHPEDGRALELMTPVYLEMNRFDDAVNAQKKAIDLLGETPDRLVKYAEALSYANDGVVSPEAVDRLEHALALDARNLRARYFLGLAAAQHDDRDKAREVWTAMLPEMVDGSPSKQDVMAKLALLDAPLDGGPTPTPEPAASFEAAAVAAQPPDEQHKTIRAMVDRLAQRLAAGGGRLDEWKRLIRARKALNETDGAQDAYNRARSAFPDDAARGELAALALELGLNGK
jgi:cytochrome c-type biogenesis protein CcmH